MHTFHLPVCGQTTNHINFLIILFFDLSEALKVDDLFFFSIKSMRFRDENYSLGRRKRRQNWVKTNKEDALAYLSLSSSHWDSWSKGNVYSSSGGYGT